VTCEPSDPTKGAEHFQVYMDERNPPFLTTRTLTESGKKPKVLLFRMGHTRFSQVADTYQSSGLH